jgi:hypothetical protein
VKISLQSKSSKEDLFFAALDVLDVLAQPGIPLSTSVPVLQLQLQRTHTRTQHTENMKNHAMRVLPS